jgi:multidrug transporter EmrE-like cation transporter
MSTDLNARRGRPRPGTGSARAGLGQLEDPVQAEDLALTEGPARTEHPASAEDLARAEGPAGTEGRRRLTPTSIALLLFAVLLAAGGQLLLKHGMQVATARAHASGDSLALTAATSPVVLGGLSIFAISAVAWLAVLSRVPLSVAYPFNALSYLIILTASAFLLHERVTVLTWAGSLLVVSGLIIVVLSQSSP